MTKASPALLKTFAVVSCTGSALKSIEEPTNYHIKLSRRIGMAMRVTAKKIGLKKYYETADKIHTIWGELLDEDSTMIENESLPELIKAFMLLVPEKNLKQYLAMSIDRSFGVKEFKHPQDELKIATSILKLDNKLNNLFGTTSYLEPIRKKKQKKIKKERTKSKKLNKHEQQVLAEKQRKEKVRSFLKEKIALAKQKKD